MKNYNDYIVEKKLNSFNVDMILEKTMFSSYKTIQHKVLKEYGSQLYFIATFNSAIVSLYPIVKQVLNSDLNIHISNYQLVLLTIFSIAEILHVNNDAIKDIKRRLKEDHYLIHLQRVKDTLLSVEKIVKVIAKTIGKTISLFIDMLAYVTILVPINDALVEILKNDGLNMATISNKILGLGIGLGILTLKTIVVKILDKLGLHTATSKVEEIIEDEKKNTYHTMRTKEKINENDGHGIDGFWRRFHQTFAIGDIVKYNGYDYATKTGLKAEIIDKRNGLYVLKFEDGIIHYGCTNDLLKKVVRIKNLVEDPYDEENWEE